MLGWVRATALEAIEPRLQSLERELVMLRSRNRDLETEKSILEDRLKASLEDRQHLWSLVGKSMDKMEVSYQMHINREWQKRGDAAPFPDAPHAGDGTKFQGPKSPFIQSPILGSAAAQAQTMKFIDEYFQKTNGE